MADDLDNAIVRVANAERMAATARAVSQAADEARVAAVRNAEAAATEMREIIDKRIATHIDAG